MKKLIVCLITDHEEENVPMTDEEIFELASLIQGDKWKGKVPMTLKIGEEIKERLVLGFMIYGKAIHDYEKIIYFGK